MGIDDWLGSGAMAGWNRSSTDSRFYNEDEAGIVERQIRIDIENTSPHRCPHVNIEWRDTSNLLD